MDFVIDPAEPASAAVCGGGLFPVRRIFCIGRNYADHVREMGGDPKSSSLVFFTKPADAVVGNGSSIPYPLMTGNLHFEGELVVALKGGGVRLQTIDEAAALIFGYAAGCDLTRRDLQAAAKDAGAPWDAAKAFDRSAPMGEILPVADAPKGFLDSARLETSINGETRQAAPLNDMIWTVPEIIISLSELFELKPGDLIFSGTPAGVGPLIPGDKVDVRIGDLPSLSFSIAE